MDRSIWHFWNHNGPGRHPDWWPLPDHVKVEGGSLRYVFSPVQKVAKLSDKFFNDFLKIADASVDNVHKLVSKYASRYGVLELCERHGLPSLIRTSSLPSIRPSHSISGTAPLDGQEMDFRNRYPSGAIGLARRSLW